MDFSKKGTEQKQQQIKSTSKKIVSKITVSFFRVLLISFVFIAIVGSFAGFGILRGLADSAPSIDQINVIPTGFTTEIRDKDGNIIQSLIGAESNRKYATIDEIPEVLRNCVISIEDERFYEHKGIDVRGIFRAGLTVFKGGIDNAEGASTITQQLLKNQVFAGGAEDTTIDRVIRKIQEQYLAVQLEDKLDKDEILEYYLNTINLGAGTYGVQTASKRYFNKDVSELNLSEAAVIAAIAKSPTNLNPITHPDNNASRRALILESMRKLGFCTEEEYNIAINDDVYSRIQSVNDEVGVTSYYSYFVDELIEQVIEDLQEKKGYTYTQASNALYSGGLSIYTTLDSQVQGILDDVYSNEEFFPEVGKYSFWELNYALSIEKSDGTTIHYHMDDLVEFFESDSRFSTYFSDKEVAEARVAEFKEAKVEEGDIVLLEKTSLIIQPQSSMVIMDQYTGQVVAMVGGRGEKTGNRTLNRATNTMRQPGSTFKILSTYLPALDSANMTLATVIDDAPYKYPNSDKYVNNWDSGPYKGLTTLRQAIYDSMNVVTVKTLEKVTADTGFAYLTKLGFTTLVDTKTTESGKVYSDKNLAMALGGITDGVKNIELTAAFAAIANSGVYTEPTLYTKILDHDGKVLLNNEPTNRQVMKESTSFLLTSAMEDVVTKGTGKVIRFTKLKMPVSGKTGTTSDDKDLWFSGYTPYYTATIWSGYDNNRSQTERTYHKRIWREVMERIHIEKELEPVPFTIPDSVEVKEICTKSGKLSVEGLCDKYVGGSTVKAEYFAKGSAPTEKCDVHVKVTVCDHSDLIANEYCPEHTLEERVYLIKEEISETKDTAYILPEKTCNIHNAGTVATPTIPPDPFNQNVPIPTIVPDDDIDIEFYFNYGND
jgi:penicillin-binding protein 1A